MQHYWSDATGISWIGDKIMLFRNHSIELPKKIRHVFLSHHRRPKRGSLQY